MSGGGEDVSEEGAEGGETGCYDCYGGFGGGPEYGRYYVNWGGFSAILCMFGERLD